MELKLNNENQTGLFGTDIGKVVKLDNMSFILPSVTGL